MGCTVKELLSRIDARELSEWEAYYKIEPFGQQVSNFTVATVAAVVANANRSQKKRTKAFSPDDFMVKFRKKRQSVDDMKKVMTQIARVNNNAINRTNSS